jgi:hypothetical protein
MKFEWKIRDNLMPLEDAEKLSNYPKNMKN